MAKWKSDDPFISVGRVRGVDNGTTATRSHDFILQSNDTSNQQPAAVDPTLKAAAGEEG